MLNYMTQVKRNLIFRATPYTAICCNMSSVFGNVPRHPNSFEAMVTFKLDKAPKKIDLSYGAYFGEDSQVWISPLVKKVDKLLTEDNTQTYDYTPFFGLDVFTRAATELLLGPEKRDGQIFAIQTLGGTGALVLGLMFLNTTSGRNVLYASDPAWEIYDEIFDKNGFQEIRRYRYWDAKNKCLDFDGMYEDLNRADENAVVVFQACAHNPTGCDLTKEQWMKISQVVKARNLFPFFDCAYLGFASGSVDEDAWPIRYFVNQGHELFCAQSFSKNFAMYGLRVGDLVVSMKSEEDLEAVKLYFLWLIRTNYLVPPRHGANIVAKILTTPEYLEEWKESLRARCERIKNLRQTLQKRLEARTRPGFWRNITEQSGFFAYTGLPIDAVKILKEKYHVYMPNNGRINVPSLNAKNFDYFIDSVVTTLEELNDKNSRRGL